MTIRHSEVTQLIEADLTVETGRTYTIPRPHHLKSDIVLSPFFSHAMQDVSLCLVILACASATMSIYFHGSPQHPTTFA